MTGTMNISLIDQTRKEVLGKKEGFRKVTIRFYYPSEKIHDAVRTDGLTPHQEKVAREGKRLRSL